MEVFLSERVGLGKYPRRATVFQLSARAIMDMCQRPTDSGEVMTE